MDNDNDIVINTNHTVIVTILWYQWNNHNSIIWIVVVRSINSGGSSSNSSGSKDLPLLIISLLLLCRPETPPPPLSLSRNDLSLSLETTSLETTSLFSYRSLFLSAQIWHYNKWVCGSIRMTGYCGGTWRVILPCWWYAHVYTSWEKTAFSLSFGPPRNFLAYFSLSSPLMYPLWSYKLAANSAFTCYSHLLYHYAGIGDSGPHILPSYSFQRGAEEVVERRERLRWDGIIVRRRGVGGRWRGG